MLIRYFVNSFWFTNLTTSGKTTKNFIIFFFLQNFIFRVFSNMYKSYKKNNYFLKSNLKFKKKTKIKRIKYMKFYFVTN